MWPAILDPPAQDEFATKIWVLDHNYSLWGRAIDELSDPGVYEYVDGIAWHGYVGEPSAMIRVHDAFPQKNAYWTEGGPDIAHPITRPISPTGRVRSTTCEQLGAVHHRRGIWRSMRRASPTSGRSPAAA